jgi:hypothetical protein
MLHGETSRPLEVRIKEHEHSQIQSLLEKSKSPNLHTKNATKYSGKRGRSYKLNRTLSTGNIRNLPVNTTWTSLQSELPLLQQKSENYNSVKIT